MPTKKSAKQHKHKSKTRTEARGAKGAKVAKKRTPPPTRKPSPKASAKKRLTRPTHKRPKPTTLRDITAAGDSGPRLATATHEVEVKAGFIVRFQDDGRMDLRDQAMLAADVAIDIPDADKAYTELVSDVFPTGHFEAGGERHLTPQGSPLDKIAAMGQAQPVDALAAGPEHQAEDRILKPSASLLSKLGSIIGHMVEGVSTTGHAVDITTALSGLQDPEVADWLQGMRDLALIPLRR